MVFKPCVMSMIICNTGMLVQTREENIAFTAGKDMAVLPVIENGWLLIEDGIIAGYGPRRQCLHSVMP